MNLRNLSIPLLATLFNLFFEYSLRGVNGFLANPLLIVFLSLPYFLWFVLVEDVIRRRRPSDWKTMLLPYIGIGSVYSVFFIPIKAYFTPPFFLGINIGLYVWCTLFWWTLLQTTMALYFANRLAPRKDMAPILSKKAWVVIMGLWLLVGVLFRSKIEYPYIAPITYVTVLCIALIAGYIFIKAKPSETVATPSRFMDLLTGGTVVFFILCSLVFAGAGKYDYHPINVNALGVVIAWTTISGVIMLIYRLISKKPFLR